ncbi:MAG TPA: MAPEG family protein [Caulobacteraceae bacterium]
MSFELTVLAWALVLGLVQIALSAAVVNGRSGWKYNLGPRDGPPPAVSTLGARLHRAQTNLFETLPLFVAAILIAHVSGREGGSTRLGAELFLGGRLVYLPLYAFGVPVLRTIAWTVAVVGLVLVFGAILRPV